MPQLDKFTYFTQFFWLCLILFTFYIAICNDGDGVLGISRILKLRNQLLSHRENKIRSKDPKTLEEISKKSFNTGLSYMYSSLFEVSQWCKTVDFLGKRNKSTFFSSFGEIRGYAYSTFESLFFVLYFHYLSNRKIRYFLVLVIRYILFLLLLKYIFITINNSVLILGGVGCSILPAEYDQFLVYLSREGQDPEWIAYIRYILENSQSTREFEFNFYSFLGIEECSQAKENIIQLYKVLFFPREHHLSFLGEFELDAIVRSALEPFEFNQSALNTILDSLRREAYGSPFYECIAVSQQHHFLGFQLLHEQEQIENLAQARRFAEALALERQTSFLEQENARLLRALSLFETDRESHS